MMQHGARQIEFDALYSGLQKARDAGHVRETIGEDGLHLYCYTESCVYERQWDAITLLSRGLILHPAQKKVVATPFPKFFNIGEHGEENVPDLSFEIFEKLDGSLIIIFFHGGEWRTATKGSLNSSQAQWAKKQLTAKAMAWLDPSVTYLAEAIFPENRIVVHYSYEGLVLLSAYKQDGHEIPYDALCDLSEKTGWRIARRHSYSAVSELLALTPTLSANEEGFVLRFANGLRLKVKGEEYRRIHALVSRLTPLAMWEAMLANDDMVEIRKQLPEEFWADFDAITANLTTQVSDIATATKTQADAVAHLSDKEVGLSLETFPENVRRFIFPYRRYGDVLSGKTRETVFRQIRPTGNRLEGYTPSYAVNRVMDESA